jgi:hypothetical protein
MRRYVGAVAVMVILCYGSGATAQTTAVLAQEEIEMAIDSGLVGNPDPHRAVIFSREISASTGRPRPTPPRRWPNGRTPRRTSTVTPYAWSSWHRPTRLPARCG